MSPTSLADSTQSSILDPPSLHACPRPNSIRESRRFAADRSPRPGDGAGASVSTDGAGAGDESGISPPAEDELSAGAGPGNRRQ